MKGCLSLILLLFVVGILGSFLVPKDDSQESSLQSSPPPSEPAPSPIAPSFPAREFWPRQVTLHVPQTFSEVAAHGTIDANLPAGSKITVSDLIQEKTILAKRGDMKAEVPIENTDFLTLAREAETKTLAAREAAHKKRIEQEKADADKIKAAEERDLAERGPKPAIIGNWIPGPVKRALQDHMKDPDSFKVREVLDITHAEVKGTKCWLVQLTFMGKNGFGGTVTAIADVYVRNNEVIDVRIMQP